MIISWKSKKNDNSLKISKLKKNENFKIGKKMKISKLEEKMKISKLEEKMKISKLEKNENFLKI